ncbi:MAG: DUF3134 domain-containing protein [Leptolyngbya sp. SIO4C1]|nr:DUF3134 domain-containing protein [Leptolyngbya sp. SIO4C1]
MSDYNPSVRQIPRTQLADVIPQRRDASILGWLESTGRLIPREPVETSTDEPDSEEISDLMGNEDNSFEEEDDDMSLEDED